VPSLGEDLFDQKLTPKKATTTPTSDSEVEISLISERPIGETRWNEKIYVMKKKIPRKQTGKAIVPSTLIL